MSAKPSHPARVLITDDEQDVRWMLSLLLRNEGFAALEAEHGTQALEIVSKGQADLMLLDIQMPGMTGLEVLREARKLNTDLPVLLLSGYGTEEAVTEAAQYGVQGFLTKPHKNDELILMVRLALASRRLRQEVSQATLGKIIRPEDLAVLEALAWPLQGRSVAIQHVARDVARVAPTDFTVIITGETGVGKELVARAIHEHSKRAAGPFVPVDCGSIPPTLIESELFGHEKGAFTGADRQRLGSFETAAGGTLFLDEIGNLPLNMQAKLLRALQERKIHRVGGTAALQLDVRVVAATNEDLEEMVQSGKFRRDLFYRLNEFSIHVPPLRERNDDIMLLAGTFLKGTKEELGKQFLEIGAAAQDALRSYGWPGNIRELRNVIRRAVLLADTRIDPEHLGLPLPSSAGAAKAVPSPDLGSGLSFKEIVHRRVSETERALLVEVLKQTGGNLAKAARILQIDYKTIRTKARQYKIECAIS